MAAVCCKFHRRHSSTHWNAIIIIYCDVTCTHHCFQPPLLHAVAKCLRTPPSSIQLLCSLLCCHRCLLALLSALWEGGSSRRKEDFVKWSGSSLPVYTMSSTFPYTAQCCDRIWPLSCLWKFACTQRFLVCSLPVEPVYSLHLTTGLVFLFLCRSRPWLRSLTQTWRLWICVPSALRVL